MTEKIIINNRDVWIMVEPYVVKEEGESKEYFIAYYTFQEPGLAGGKMLTEEDQSPKLFESPVEALEFATEELIKVLV